MKQICPYCFQPVISLYGHKCDDLPPNFEFDKKISTAAFFTPLYAFADGLRSNGSLDIYKLNPLKYQIAFLKIYPAFVEGDIEDVKIRQFIEDVIQKSSQKNRNPSKKETTFSQLDAPTSISDTQDSEVIKQLCPYCYNLFRNLGDHQCDEMVKEKGISFHFESHYCSEELLKYLYKRLNAFTSLRQVDLQKINLSEYRQWFEDFYTVFESMDNPDLEKAKREVFQRQQVREKMRENSKTGDQSLPNETKSDISPTSKSQKSYPNRYEGLCPYCFQIFPSLVQHECEKESSPIWDHLQLTYISDEFYERLYLETRALTQSKRIDPIRIDRVKYRKTFEKLLQEFKNIHAQKDIESLDINQNPNLSYLIDDKQLFEFNLSSNQKSLNVQNITDITDEDLQEMDILEILNHDLDLNKPSSINRSTKSQFRKSPPPEEADMPWCFSCRLMINCPRGLNSDEMETTFECSEYESHQLNESTQKDSIYITKDNDNRPPQYEESICMICNYYADCLRGFSEREKERIFQCPDYTVASHQDMDNPSLDTEQHIQLRSLYLDSQDEWESIDQPSSSIKDSGLNNLDSEKQALLQDILKKWAMERGQLKVYCKSCEQEMTKIITTKKEFYRCLNYPECRNIADPWFVSQSVKKGVVSHVEHGDLLILYQYNQEKNIVFVNRIYSEGKLFR